MSGNGRIIYIAGAGIAGLTLALALGKFGARVVVLERQPSVQEFGAGLQISANARKVLDRLGLDEALNERAFAPEGIDVYPLGANRPLVTLELGERIATRFGAPYAVMHRADLADMLHRATKRFANIDVLFNVRSHDVVSHEAGVSVVVDEADGKTRTARAFAFIGADGVDPAANACTLLNDIGDYDSHACDIDSGWYVEDTAKREVVTKAGIRNSHHDATQNGGGQANPGKSHPQRRHEGRNAELDVDEAVEKTDKAADENRGRYREEANCNSGEIIRDQHGGRYGADGNHALGREVD